MWLLKTRIWALLALACVPVPMVPTQHIFLEPSLSLQFLDSFFFFFFFLSNAVLISLLGQYWGETIDFGSIMPVGVIPEAKWHVLHYMLN